jgi:hypothetical protein
VFLVVAIASAVVLVNPEKLIFLPLTGYLLYGVKDGLLAARTPPGQIGDRINTQQEV